MHLHFQLLQQCDYIYQNKFFKCTYVHLCLFHLKLLQHVPVPFSNGLLTNNSTVWSLLVSVSITSTEVPFTQVAGIFTVSATSEPFGASFVISMHSMEPALTISSSVIRLLVHTSENNIISFGRKSLLAFTIN